MIIDSSDIAAKNDQFIVASEGIMQNVVFTNSCIDVLRASAYLPIDGPDDLTIIRLAIRLINSAGAAGIAILNGYYQPGAAHIRDIIEVSFLLDLFRRERGEIAVWREASDEVLWRRFRPEKLKSRLDHYEGGKPSYRKPAYKFFSEHGVHARPLAVGLISPQSLTMVGPFPDEDRIAGLSLEIARHLGAGTMFLIRSATHSKLDESAPEVADFIRASITFFDNVEAFRRRAGAAALPEASD